MDVNEKAQAHPQWIGAAMPTLTNLPTIAEHLEHGQDVILTCGQCDRQRELDLAALVAAGHAIERCARCVGDANGADPGGSP